MKRKFIQLLAITVSIMMMLCACQTSGDTTPPEPVTPVVEQPSQENEAPTERTVTDMAGREVTVPAEINSIATFGSIGVLNAFVGMMGESDKICNNMSPRFQNGNNAPIQYKFAPQMESLPIFEDSEILIEEVLKAKPDLCIAMTVDTADYLADNGLACIVLEWRTLDDIPVAVNLMGEVLNKPERAKEYLDYFDASIAKAADLIKDISDEDKVTAIYGNITEFSQPHIIAEWWIPRAGGISVTDNGRTDENYTYTLEELLQWNPEVMFVSGKSQLEEIAEESRMKDIPAVKNNRIYVIPAVAHNWGNRTVEQPLTIFWALNKFYPEKMSDEEFKDEVRYFYSTFFNYDITDEDIATFIG